MAHSNGGYALLSRRERAWIVGNITVSKAIQRDIRYRIRRKLEILCAEELPLLMNKGWFGHDVNVLCQQGKFVFNADPRSVVGNDDGVAPNNDGYNNGGGRWSSSVKIQPKTWRKVNDNGQIPADVETKTTIKNTKWAGSDLNQRPPPCQGGILTKLDHRPHIQINRLPLNRLNIFSSIITNMTQAI
jgi:hypothetical protein